MKLLQFMVPDDIGAYVVVFNNCPAPDGHITTMVTAGKLDKGTVTRVFKYDGKELYEFNNEGEYECVSTMR